MMNIPIGAFIASLVLAFVVGYALCGIINDRKEGG